MNMIDKLLVQCCDLFTTTQSTITPLSQLELLAVVSVLKEMQVISKPAYKGVL